MFDMPSKYYYTSIQDVNYKHACIMYNNNKNYLYENRSQSINIDQNIETNINSNFDIFIK